MDALAQQTDLLSVSIDRETQNFDRYNLRPPYCPEAVAVPRSTEELRDAVRLATGQKMPVLPVGGGTSLWRGVTAAGGGLAISFNSLNRILEIRPSNLTAVAEAGVTYAKLWAALQPHGLRLPVLPALPEVSTLGGEASRNLGSPKSLRYGHLRHFVLGTEFITAEGKIVTAGGKSVKNVAGYDLNSLVVGSWGTLGIISSLIVRLIPSPEQEKIFFLSFEQIDDALTAAKELLHTGLSPAAVHLLSPAQADSVPGLPVSKGWLIVIACDGTRESLMKHEAKIMELGGRAFCFDAASAMDSYWCQFVSLFEGDPSESKDFAGTLFVSRKFAAETTKGLHVLLNNKDQAKIWTDLGTGRLRFALPVHGAIQNQIESELIRLAGAQQGILTLANPFQIFRPTKSPAHLQILKRLKDAMDPFHILNPQAEILKGVL